MPHFFIDRPIFAWVIALSILLAGTLCFKQLPISQYPEVAPPGLTVTATYPGADAQLVEDMVTRLIEDAVNGLDDLLYMESASDANGTMTLTLTFKTGIDLDIAAVQTQNRIKQVEARLPQEVARQGITVAKSRRNFLMFVTMFSPNQSMDAVDLGSYTAANIINNIRQVKGVGEAILFGTEYAMRIWLDQMQLSSFNITPSEVVAAIRQQNVQVATGELGQLPSAKGQLLNASITAPGRLNTPEAFQEIILRSDGQGGIIRLKDVAKVELGAQGYLTRARLNQQPIAAVGIKLSPDGNALETAAAVRARMAELKTFFPDDMDWDVPYDTSRFVDIAIEQVVKTLFEAFVLVFLVMFVFMGSLRAAVIPTLVVPISLIGTLVGLYLFGYSINVLTMFAMVLAIGTVVDDAIVVVENVQRIIDEERLPPNQATHKAMTQIINPIIGITIVLCAVFIPMAFFGGSVGAIYRQFAVTLVLTLIFSTLLALSLTPALSAKLLRPNVVTKEGGQDAEQNLVSASSDGFFTWFDRVFDKIRSGYLSSAVWMIHRPLRILLVYIALVGVAIWCLWRLPSGFLPDEDQGYFISVIQLPAGATQERTLEVLEQVESYVLSQPEVEKVVGVLGFSFFGNGQNAALAFVRLKDWAERTDPEWHALQVVQRANQALFGTKEAFLFSVNPPPIPELASIGGFDFRLQDRGNHGREALRMEQFKLLGMASAEPTLAGVRPEGQGASPQLQLNIDRERAQAHGVSIQTINDALAVAFGSAYVNDFLRSGRVLQVIVQLDPTQRATPDQLLMIKVRNAEGEQLSLKEFVTYEWTVGGRKLDRYNGLPSFKIAGSPAPGASTGEALATMERLAEQLPAGYGYEWSTTSYEEKLSGSQAPLLFGLSVLVVFMCLAALYESWSIPLAVILVVPLGLLGAVLAVTLRELPNDVYFKVGLIAIIGLSAKNAILIVEFARKLQSEGVGLIEATTEACRLRFRPIIMTSITFMLGVLPLAISSGAGAASRIAIGTGVLGGMFAATVLAVFAVPVLYLLIRKLFPESSETSESAKA